MKSVVTNQTINIQNYCYATILNFLDELDELMNCFAKKLLKAESNKTMFYHNAQLMKQTLHQQNLTPAELLRLGDEIYKIYIGTCQKSSSKRNNLSSFNGQFLVEVCDPTSGQLVKNDRERLLTMSLYQASKHLTELKLALERSTIGFNEISTFILLRKFAEFRFERFDETNTFKPNIDFPKIKNKLYLNYMNEYKNSTP